MGDFYYTELDDNEQIVFAVLTASSSSSNSTSVMGNEVSSSHESRERKIGVTNQRIIIETANAPEATQSIPNSDVRQVFVKRGEFMGRPSRTLARLETAQGQSIELGMQLFNAEDEAQIQPTFPNATISYLEEEKKKSKGLLGFLGLR